MSYPTPQQILRVQGDLLEVAMIGFLNEAFTLIRKSPTRSCFIEIPAEVEPDLWYHHVRRALPVEWCLEMRVRFLRIYPEKGQ